MAVATDLALGTVLLAGDLAGSSNANTPQLTPTGVTPGEYKGASVVVDAKGRILHARNMSYYDVGCATDTECGVVSVTDNHFIVKTGDQISLNKASTTEFGVVKLGAGFGKDCCEIFVDYVEATPTTLGVVTVPTSGNIVIDGAGNISVPIATTGVIGLVKAVSANGLDLTDGVLTYTPPDASSDSKGYVQVGNGFVVAAGQLSIPTASTSAAGLFRMSSDFDFSSNTYSYTDVATTSSVGFVKIGSGLVVDEDGTLNRGPGVATTSVKGVVQVEAANGLAVTAGVLSWSPSNATTSVKGVVQVGASMAVSSGVISMSNASGTATKGIVGVSGNGNLQIVDGLIDFGPKVAMLDSHNTWTAAQVVSKVTAVASGTTALNFADGNVFDITLGGNSTFSAPSNMVGGGQYIIIIRQDSTGGRTLNFPAGWAFLDNKGNATFGKAIGSSANAISVITLTAIDSTNAVCQINRNFA